MSKWDLVHTGVAHLGACRWAAVVTSREGRCRLAGDLEGGCPPAAWEPSARPTHLTVAGGRPGAGHLPSQTSPVPTLCLERFKGLVPTSLSPLGLTILDLVASRDEVLTPS